MITTGKVHITCPVAKVGKTEDGEEPRALSELEVRVIKTWYDTQHQQQQATKGNLCATERNFSAAGAHREEDEVNYQGARVAVGKAANGVVDAQAATRSTPVRLYDCEADTEEYPHRISRTTWDEELLESQDGAAMSVHF